MSPDSVPMPSARRGEQPPVPSHATHEVLNQPGDLVDYNAFTGDAALVDAARTFGGDWATPRLEECGALVGSARVQQAARAANRNDPELVTHDRFGHRIDVVEYHPAWHELMALIFSSECHSLAWTERRQTPRRPRGTSRAELPVEPG